MNKFLTSNLKLTKTKTTTSNSYFNCTSCNTYEWVPIS